MTPKQGGPLAERYPVSDQRLGASMVIYDETGRIASLKKTDGFAERVSLKHDICARKLQVIQVDRLSCLSPGDIPEDYVFWFNLCAAHGVVLATPERVYDLREKKDWSEALDELGFEPEDKIYLDRDGNRGQFDGGMYGKRLLMENSPPPYVYETSLGGLTIDFAQLEQMERVWFLSEQHSVEDVAERVGLPLSVVRQAVSVERLLFYQGLWLDPETGGLRKGPWPVLMSSEQASHILANRKVRI